MWYLVRRGPMPGTFDRALKDQAIKNGVDVRFNSTKTHLPSGGIVAHGPRKVDATAAGYLFETDGADGAYAVASDRLAPKGYSYLLIWKGRGTVASCQFADFHREREYVERTVEFFRRKVGFSMNNPRPFGGFGNFFSSPKVAKGRLLYAGEAAGFQDALFGFGMRYAMVSGWLAARAWLSGKPESYEGLVRSRFGRCLKLGMVNRLGYEIFGDLGYARLLKTVCGASDPRERMRKLYARGPIRSLLFGPAKYRMRKKGDLVAACRDDCT